MGFKINNAKDLQDTLQTLHDQITDLRDRATKGEEVAEELGKLRQSFETFKQYATPRQTHVDGIDGRKFMLSRALHALSLKARGEADPWEKAGAGYEKEAIEAILRKKDSGLSDETNLGFLIPGQVMDDVIELLREKQILARLGVTIIPDLAGAEVSWPKETADGDSGWRGEGGTSTTTADAKVEMVNIRPHTAYALRRIYNSWLRAGNMRAEAFVRKQLFEQLVRRIERGYWNGSGSGAPLGVFNYAGLNSVDFASGSPTVVLLQKMIEEIEADDADIGSLHWAMVPRARSKISQIAASDTTHRQGTPIFTMGDPSKADPGTILGIPYLTSNLIGSTSSLTDIILGVFEKSILGNWGDTRLRVSREGQTAFLEDQTWFLLEQDADTAVLYEEAFCVGKDLSLT